MSDDIQYIFDNINIINDNIQIIYDLSEYLKHSIELFIYVNTLPEIYKILNLYDTNTRQRISIDNNNIEKIISKYIKNNDFNLIIKSINDFNKYNNKDKIDFFPDLYKNHSTYNIKFTNSSNTEIDSIENIFSTINNITNDNDIKEILKYIDNNLITYIINSFNNFRKLYLKDIKLEYEKKYNTYEGSYIKTIDTNKENKENIEHLVNNYLLFLSIQVYNIFKSDISTYRNANKIIGTKFEDKKKNEYVLKFYEVIKKDMIPKKTYFEKLTYLDERMKLSQDQYEDYINQLLQLL